MFKLAIRTLRYRKGGLAASFMALFIGAVIIMFCGGLMETAIRQDVPPKRLNTPIVITSSEASRERARLDAGLVEQVRKVNGVAKAIADVSFPAVVMSDGRPVGETHGLAGHSWSSAQLTPYALTKGQVPLAGEIVVDEGTAEQAKISVGKAVTVSVRGAIETFRLAGIARADAVRGSALFFSETDTQRLLKPGHKIDTIGIIPTANTSIETLQSRLTTALAEHSVAVYSGDDRGLAEFPAAASAGRTLIVMVAPFGGGAVALAVFVVGGTLGILIRQRRREIALLQSVGATSGQLRQMILIETIFVTIFAAALAILPSYYLGSAVLTTLGENNVVSDAIVYRQGWIPLGVGVVGSLLIAALSALLASRYAVRMRPVEGLAEATVPRLWVGPAKLAIAAICVAGGIALGLVTVMVMSGPIAAATAGPATLLLVSAFALVGLPLATIALKVFGRPLEKISGIPGRLALMNANVRKASLAALIAPTMLMTGLALSTLYQQSTQVSAARSAYTEDMKADIVLLSTTGGFPHNFVSTVQKTPGVAGASALVSSEGFYIEKNGERAKKPVPLRGIDPDGIESTQPIKVTDGSIADLQGNAVALPTTHAKSREYNVNDQITMQLGDGTRVKLKVVALFEARKGYETLLLPASLLTPHTTSQLVPQILVRSSTQDTSGAIGSLYQLRRVQPGLVAGDRSVLDTASEKEIEIGTLMNYLSLVLIVGYTIIYLVNTLIVATLDRRREFALQRLIGATRGQILRMLAVEAALLALAGILFGTLAAPVTLMSFSWAVTGSLLPQGSILLYIGVAAVTIALTFAAILLPAWFILRRPAIESAAHHE